MKKVIQIKDVDSMYFAGAGDKNIKFIEKKFNSNMVLRGNELLLDGDKSEIKIIEKLVHNMINTIMRKNHISTSDIQLLLSSESNEENYNCNDPASENIIL